MPETVRTPEKEAELLAAVVKNGGNISKSCEEVGIGRQTVYDWKDAHEDFAQALEKACERGVDALEDEATRRAFHGVEEPVYQGGARIGTIQKYSDTLMIFLMKGRRRAKYGDRHVADVNLRGAKALTNEQAMAEIAALSQEMRFKYQLVEIDDGEKD